MLMQFRLFVFMASRIMRKNFKTRGGREKDFQAAILLGAPDRKAPETQN